MKEEILKKLDRLAYIKQICYGLGIVPESATDFWNDLKELQDQLKKCN